MIGTFKMLLVGGNGIALVLALYIVFKILRMSSRFYWNYGDLDIQIPLRMRMLRHLLALLVVVIIVVTLNLAIGVLESIVE